MCTKFRKKQAVINSGPIDMWALTKIIIGLVIVAFLAGILVGSVS